MWPQCFQCGEEPGGCSTAFMIAPPAGELLVLSLWLITGHGKGNYESTHMERIIL